MYFSVTNAAVLYIHLLYNKMPGFQVANAFIPYHGFPGLSAQLHITHTFIIQLQFARAELQVNIAHTLVL